MGKFSFASEWIKFESEWDMLDEFETSTSARFARTGAGHSENQLELVAERFRIRNRPNLNKPKQSNETKFNDRKLNCASNKQETCHEQFCRSKFTNSPLKSNAISIIGLISSSTLLVIAFQSVLMPFRPGPCKSGSRSSQLGPLLALAASLNSSAWSEADELVLDHETAAAAHLMRGRSGETSGGGSRQSGGKSDSREDLIEFLEGLPITSVGQKHTAQFECNATTTTTRSSKLVWVKLIRNASSLLDDITPLSIDERTITRDKRFKVLHQPANSKWALTIDNVNLNDDDAFYLCQVGGGGTAQRLSFVGGAKLKVLVPPRIVEDETSPNLVQSDEFKALRLACKVISEPQSQVSWRREDGKSLDGLEQRFKHYLERPGPHQVVSVDSAELVFSSIRRDQAGAYLCIASNGVQPGVSQRINVAVVNCRQSSEPKSRAEACGQPGGEFLSTTTGAAATATTTTTTTTTTATAAASAVTNRQAGQRRTNAWNSNGRSPPDSSQANGDRQLSRRVQSQLDRSRGSRYNNQSNRRTNQAGGQQRPAEPEAKTAPVSSGTPSRSSFEFHLILLAAAAIPMARWSWMRLNQIELC